MKRIPSDPVTVSQRQYHISCGVRYTQSGPWLFNFLLNGLGKNASGQNCFFNVFQWIFGDLWWFCFCIFFKKIHSSAGYELLQQIETCIKIGSICVCCYGPGSLESRSSDSDTRSSNCPALMADSGRGRLQGPQLPRVHGRASPAGEGRPYIMILALQLAWWYVGLWKLLCLQW